MKEIKITIKRIWMEIAWLTLCLIVAEGMNLYAIKKFETNWNEIWTQLPIVLFLAFIFYAIFAVTRILVRLIVISCKAISQLYVCEK